MNRLYIFVTVVLLSNLCNAQDWKVFPYSPPGSVISFPKDEGRHPSTPVEWWYTSGHLTGATSGKTYSFMLAYFSYPASVFDGFRILNVTDEATGKFYQDTRPVNYTTLATDHLDIQATVYHAENERWSNKVGADNKLIPYEYTIQAASANVGLNLNCISVKRPLILGKTGYFELSSTGHTYYYSQTKNEISGKLTVNGVTEEVSGISWIDRQYGDFSPLNEEKYEWFHVQLSNGMDINLWNIFTAKNTIPDNSKYRLLSAYINDQTQYTISDFNIERLAFNRMPDGVMCYSSKWRVTSEKNKVDLTITINNNNNEVALPFRFFEGATSVSGTVNGQAVTGFGFAELLHTYENPKINIADPTGGIYNPASPILWQLMNPDEGRPVTYDLEYSIDNKATFKPIATALTDTFYLWNQPAIPNGDNIWFKITARSIDGKLEGVALSNSASSVSLNTDNNKIKIVPNPVGRNLFLQPAFQMDNPLCRIVDANGRVVHIIKGNTFTNKIDVSFLPPGMYFLNIDSPGKKTVLKFIKE